MDDERRAQRLRMFMPVQLYGLLGDEPFSERTETFNVSACGGLVLVSADVARAQKLILTNLQTDQDLICRVIRLTRTRRGQMLAGLEFLQSVPGFWRASPTKGEPALRSNRLPEELNVSRARNISVVDLRVRR
jgi:hypothetical protein